MAELKQHSGEAVNRLTLSKQAIEAELSEIRKEVQTLTEKLGKAPEPLTRCATKLPSSKRLSVIYPGGDSPAVGEKANA